MMPNVIEIMAGDMSQIIDLAKTNLKSVTPVYNVQGYGVKGDGIADDTAAIQSVMNTVTSAGGGVVYFPKGTYIISAPLMINGDNLTLMSLDGAVIKLKDNCSPKPFSLLVAQGTTKNNISINGITFDGNRANNIDHGTPDVNGNQGQYWCGTLLALVNLTSVNNVKIERCKFLNSWGNGVWVNDCNDVTIRNNILQDYRISGIDIRNNTSIAGIPINAIVEGNECSGGVVGIHGIFGPQYVKISNNHCFNNRDSNRFPSIGYSGTYPNVWPTTGGFKAYGTSGYVSPALVGDGAGIELTGYYTDPAATRDAFFTIYGNTCKENMIGIRLEEETQNCSVTSNVCTYNDKHGILAFSTRFCTFVGNTCAYNLTHGMSIEKLTGKAIPEQHVIDGNTFTQNKQFGINMQGVQKCIISNNVISDNNQDTTAIGGGIQLILSDGTTCNRNIIRGNSIISYSNNDKYGIHSTDATNYENFVDGNIFDGTFTTVIDLGLNNNKISGNIGYNTSGWGITNIAAGASSVVVNHGMAFSPDSGQLHVTPVNDVGSGIRWWVDTINATSFTIRTSAAVASPTYFNWFVADDKY